MSIHTLCEHCALPLGSWPNIRQIEGEERQFCCYGCFVGWQIGRGGGEESAAVGLLIRLGIGAFLAMNIMLFSLAIYSGGIDTSEPWLRDVIHVVLLLFATPVMIVLGGPFFVEAAQKIAQGRVNASTLIAIGSGAAYVYSVVVILSGGERVYFDTATMVLGLFTLGRYLEANGRARAMRNLEPMMSPQMTEVTLVEHGCERRRSLKRVNAGDLVRFQPGERISVDGIVVDGAGFADESWLSGESRPMEKIVGDTLLAGSINLDGIITVKALADGLDARWVRICASLRKSLLEPTAIQTVTDRVAAYFIPGVLVVSLLTVWFWTTVGSTEQALMHGLAVLVVACPCALGLAAPLATAMALERLASVGCLLRSGDSCYRLAAVSRLALDKTGTLTFGQAEVTGILAQGISKETLMVYAAALESGSFHPLARGIVSITEQQGGTKIGQECSCHSRQRYSRQCRQSNSRGR